MRQQLFFAILLFTLAGLYACQPDPGAGRERITPETPVEVNNLYPEPAVLYSPPVIRGWVQYVNSKLEEFEKKGAYTITRDDGNYEVTAWIAGGEIIRLYVLKPSTRVQQWFYLNRYLIPMLREVGPVGDTGDFYERIYYYTGTDSLIHARERRAETAGELSDADWYRYEPQGELAADPKALRRSAIKFIQGQ